LVAGWIVYFTLTASVLLYLWWKRARAWVIVVAPAAGTVVTFSLILSGPIPDTSADLHDSSTFFDGIWPVLVWALVAASLTAAIGLVTLRGARTQAEPSAEEGSGT
jgi:Na+/proline symporter